MGATPMQLPLTNGSSSPTQNRSEEDEVFFKKMRGGLMIVAILAAGSTYQAGLNPPGGFWQEDYNNNNNNNNNNHNINVARAGMPILHDRFFPRYQTFFYCNAISFLSSLVIIILLMNKNFFLDPKKIKALKIAMVLDLFAFTAAYAVGSGRLVTTSVYVFLVMGAVFLCVISLAWHHSLLQSVVGMMPQRWRRMQDTVQAEMQPQSDQV